MTSNLRDRISTLSLPDLPSLNPQTIKLPDVTLPHFTRPNITLPNIPHPNITLPNVTLPNVTLPKIAMPKVKLPEVALTAIKLPNLKAPSLKLPEIKWLKSSIQTEESCNKEENTVNSDFEFAYTEYAIHIEEFLKEPQIVPTQSEFSKLKDVDATWHVTRFGGNVARANQLLNRYSNIYPYDHNRIKLQNHIGDGDYINGSYITDMTCNGIALANSDSMPSKQDSGPNLDLTKFSNINFLASQGPMYHTCVHHLQMIYENKVDIIIMLTSLKEGNSISDKCEQYWPFMSEKKRKFGHMEITILDEVSIHPDITKRVFALRNYNSVGQDDDSDYVTGCQTIVQLHYEGWPDYGVPETADDLVNMVKDVREIIQGDQTRKARYNILAHCSAGVGRTGTFIALYKLMETIEDTLIDYDPPGDEYHDSATAWVQPATKNSLDIFSTVLALRCRRTEMVQSFAQYKYIYASASLYAKQINDVHSLASAYH